MSMEDSCDDVDAWQFLCDERLPVSLGLAELPKDEILFRFAENVRSSDISPTSYQRVRLNTANSKPETAMLTSSIGTVSFMTSPALCSVWYQVYSTTSR